MNQQQPTPSSISLNLAGNALSYLGQIGLRSYQLDTMNKASELIGRDTGTIGSSDALDAQKNELKDTIAEVKSLYAFTGDENAITTMNMLQKKSNILNNIQFNADGEAEVSDSFGNNNSIKNEEISIKTSMVDPEANNSENAVTERVNEYLKYGSESDSEQQRIEKLREIANNTVEDESTLNSYNKILDNISANKSIVAEISNINKKLSSTSIDKQSAFEITKSVSSLRKKIKSNIDSVSPEIQNEYAKVIYKFKNWKLNNGK